MTISKSMAKRLAIQEAAQPKAEEPSDSELLRFLIARMKALNLKMDRKANFYLPGHVLARHRATSPRQAIIAAYKEYQENCKANAGNFGDGYSLGE